MSSTVSFDILAWTLYNNGKGNYTILWKFWIKIFEILVEVLRSTNILRTEIYGMGTMNFVTSTHTKILPRENFTSQKLLLLNQQNFYPAKIPRYTISTYQSVTTDCFTILCVSTSENMTCNHLLLFTFPEFKDQNVLYTCSMPGWS